MKTSVSSDKLKQKRKNWAQSSFSGRGPASATDDKIVASSHTEDHGNVGKLNSDSRKFKSQGKDKTEKSSKNKQAVKIIEDVIVREKKVEHKRPQSAPPKRRVVAKSPEEKTVELGEFSKSLKLLGMDVPSNRTEATKVESQEIIVKTKEPTFRTRLLKRSGSYADLTKNLNKEMKITDFEAIKSNLSKAVFEKWYFKKCEEERDKKSKQKEEEEIKAKEEEEKRKEIMEQSKEEFIKWLDSKKEQLKKEKNKKEVEERGKNARRKSVNSEEVEKKRKEWLENKKLDLLKHRENENLKKKKEEEEKIEQDSKRIEAEKTFLKWKEEKEKEFREKAEKEKEHRKKKEEDKIEQKKEADLAFMGWKNKKAAKIKADKEKKKKEREQQETCQHESEKEGASVTDHPKEITASKDEEVKVEQNENVIKEKLSKKKKDDKLEDAKLAYEAWLDYIEARDEERIMFDEERKKILMWKPPWCPGGKAMF